jgi:hypothetical protein
MEGLDVLLADLPADALDRICGSLLAMEFSVRALLFCCKWPYTSGVPLWESVLAARLGDELRGVRDRATATCALRVLEEAPHDVVRRVALRLLALPDVYMYARDFHPDGVTKRDDRLRWFRVRAIHLARGQYRYSPGVDVVGERCMRNVRLDRLFFHADVETLAAWRASRLESEVKGADAVFDDDASEVQMARSRHLFDEADRQRSACMVPIFGFLDHGNVIARSSQSVAINPCVAAHFSRDRRSTPSKKGSQPVSNVR